MLYHERRAKKAGYSVIVGVDEAGRGPLAGPVVVAAVVLRSFRFACRIDDSKKLTPARRQAAFDAIIQKSIFAIGLMNEDVIDSINVSRATHGAVDMAVMRLLKLVKRPRPTLKNTILLLDGRLHSSTSYREKEIIGGDGVSLSIAAASILAKVTRDRIMMGYDRIYPQYRFSVHKGYGTQEHLERIARFGLSPIHRLTFCKKFIPQPLGERS